MKAKLEQIQGIPGPTDTDVGKALTYKGGAEFEWLPSGISTPATISTPGVIELATLAETLAGIDETKAVPPSGIAAALANEAAARNSAITAALMGFEASSGSGVSAEYVTNLLNAETASRINAVNTAITGEAMSRDTSIAAALADAKAYVDARLAEYLLVSGSVGSVASVAGKTGAVTLVSTDITDATAFGRALLTANSTAVQRTALGLGVAATLAVGTEANTLAAGNDGRFAASASHIANQTNPHGTTAAQVGAYTKAEVDAKDVAVREFVASYVATAISNLQITQQATFPGPFADDVAAATGNVPLNSAYRSTSGVIVWRQV